MRLGIERRLIAYSIVTTLAVLLVHALAMMLRKTFAPTLPAVAAELAWLTVAVMLISMLFSPRFARDLQQLLVSVAVAGTALAIAAVFGIAPLLPLVALLVVCPVATIVSNRIAQQLPAWLDGVAGRSPVRSALWLLAALLMVAQTARLSSWVSDPSENWWITTDHPLFAGHLCMTAYVYAADLNRQGVDNVYDQSLYPGLNPEAEVHTTIANLHPEDPYQYPPQFLLLPRLAIALTSDFELIKIFWLFLQAIFFGFIAWSVARFIGGEIGLAAALLIPVVWISFPVLSNLQYGQFHMMSIMLAVAAMMWFSQQRYLVGGAALAFAILSKAAPVILVIYLVARRRWRELGWTVAFGAAFSLLAVATLGPEPFIAFFNYQLPKLQSGAAFAFAEVWPDFREILIAGNQSPFAFISKLDALGFPGMTLSLAKLTHLLYTLGVVALAVFAARIKGSKERQLLIWLALLNLAAMVSKGAWGDYIPIGTIWLLTFMVKDLTRTAARRLVLALLWVFMFLSLGVLPLPGLDQPEVYISLAAVGMLLTIGFNVWVLIYQRRMEKAPAKR